MNKTRTVSRTKRVEALRAVIEHTNRFKTDVDALAAMDKLAMELQTELATARAEERERCSRVCESTPGTARMIACEIRALTDEPNAATRDKQSLPDTNSADWEGPYSQPNISGNLPDTGVAAPTSDEGLVERLRYWAKRYEDFWPRTTEEPSGILDTLREAADALEHNQQAHTELLEIHHAVMNPLEIVFVGTNTFTVKMVKEFIKESLSRWRGASHD